MFIDSFVDFFPTKIALEPSKIVYVDFSYIVIGNLTKTSFEKMSHSRELLFCLNRFFSWNQFNDEVKRVFSFEILISFSKAILMKSLFLHYFSTLGFFKNFEENVWILKRKDCRYIFSEFPPTSLLPLNYSVFLSCLFQ